MAAAAAAAALLPWRRSKWVLVGREERKRPGKGWAPRLNCASLLAGLLGSCPELWPAGALGGLFRRRRRTAQLNAEEPTFRACYLGHAPTLLAKGEGCAEAAVEKLWARSQAGRRGARMQLSLGPQGLHLRPGAAVAAAAAREGRPRASHAYLLHRITYCAADRRHPRVLAWVYRHQVKNKAVALRCHAVLLSRAEKAQAAARLLFQTSAAAFDEFKRLQRRSDARRLQRQLLGEAVVPLAPLRRLLNAKCPYRPPPDRGRNGPRLSSIQEEEEKEEEEEEEEGRRRKEQPVALGTATGAPLDWLATRSIICAIGSAGPALWADHTAHRGHPGADLPGPKMTRCLEQPEMQTLVREFQFCNLQGALPVGDMASWRPPSREPPCLSR